MRISIIVAVAGNGVIGSNGGLPWRMPSDLKAFRSLTMGKPVIMGRKTFQSLPKALDGRDNIVVTRDTGWAVEGAEKAASLAAALRLAKGHVARRGGDEVMVIGGGEIYAAALPFADRVYLTRVHATLDGDTRFPDLDERVWRIASSARLTRGPKDDHDATLTIFERIGPRESGHDAPL